MKIVQILRSVFLCLFFTFSFYAVHAQNLTFSSEDGLQLSEDYRIGYELTLPLTAISDSDKAVTFRDYNTELCSVRIDEKQMLLVLELDLRAQPRWSVKEWNAFLSRCKSN